MDGKEVVKIIERELFFKDISKGEFYEACGLNSTTLSNWRNGTFKPSAQKLHIIEDYLGISFEEELGESYRGGMSEEEAELLQTIRERSDLRTLLESVKGLPKSEVFSLMAEIERRKETNS